MNKSRPSRTELERDRDNWKKEAGRRFIFCMGLLVIIIFITQISINQQRNLQSENSQLKENISTLNNQLNISKSEIQNNLSSGLYCSDGLFLPYYETNSFWDYAQEVSFKNIIMSGEFIGINCEVLK